MSGTIAKKYFSAVMAAVFLCTLLLGAIVVTSFDKVSAFDYPKLLNRSLRLESVRPGDTTNYTFSWRYPSNTSVRSIKMVVCNDPYVLDPCSATPNSDFSAALLSNQTGAVTGFSIASQTTNEMVLTRASAPAGTGQSTYVFDDVVNPSGVHAKFFVQIFTYPTADASGVPNHISSVANAITEPIVITTVVPPILYFCVGLTIDVWCENSYGDRIDYGTLDAINGHSATSQFGVATNAVGGYVVTANGNTMTSGNKTIAPLSSPDVYTPGVQQFGINLRANTNPALGQDAYGSGIGTVSTSYDVPDVFQFNSGDVIASSVTGSLFNTYTVTYIVNVDPALPSGVYNTTIAYICTAAF